MEVYNGRPGVGTQKRYAVSFANGEFCVVVAMDSIQARRNACRAMCNGLAEIESVKVIDANGRPVAEEN